MNPVIPSILPTELLGLSCKTANSLGTEPVFTFFAAAVGPESNSTLYTGGAQEIVVAWPTTKSIDYL